MGDDWNFIAVTSDAKEALSFRQLPNTVVVKLRDPNSTLPQREYNLYMKVEDDNEHQIPGIYREQDKKDLQDVFWKTGISARFELRANPAS